MKERVKKMTYKQELKETRTKRMMTPCQIETPFLQEIIEHVRYAASAKNEQIIRYALINEPEKVKTIFEATNLYTTHVIPHEAAPSAFIVMGTMNKNYHDILLGIDMGIAYQIIREYLHQQGYCDICIFSFDRNRVKTVIEKTIFEPQLLVAIGKSDQVVNVFDSQENGYFKNEQGEHCINKLTAKTLMIK